MNYSDNGIDHDFILSLFGIFEEKNKKIKASITDYTKIDDERLYALFDVIQENDIINQDIIKKIEINCGINLNNLISTQEYKDYLIKKQTDKFNL